MRDSLVVVHSHWRVGGVRSVIEGVLPAIARESGWSQIILVSGEAAPVAWLEKIQKKVHEACASSVVREVVVPEVGYVSEMKGPPDIAMLRKRWSSLIHSESPAAFWWHNPGLGRNVPAVEALLQAAGGMDFPLLFHHHDLWCDHRWNRWAEMESCGYRHVDEVARVLFSSNPGVVHLTINARDTGLFQAALGDRVRKLGNPFDPPPGVTEEEKQLARDWLQQQIGANSGVPLWLAPCRLLRRKNLLESLLLLHRQSAGGVLVTSDLVASMDEHVYAQALAELAQMESSRLRLVDFGAPGAPGMPALQAAADVLVQSSLQEGFGLLFMEAAEGGRQLLCRRLPNVWPDLAERGYEFPMSYDEVQVDLLPGEQEAEARRQAEVLAKWKRSLPQPWQTMVGEMNFTDKLDDGEAAAFSRLTLKGQLAVLRGQIAHGHVIPLEGKAATRDRQLPDFTSVEYAKQFLEIVVLRGRCDFTPDADAAVRLQNSLVADAVGVENVFPILLSPSPA